MWPWSTPSGGQYKSFLSWIYSRKFSIFYVLAILVVNLIFGFAPRRHCWEGDWNIVFQCNWMMWMAQFKEDFWHFMATSMTTIWFHNDFVHILFVILFGFLFPVQSFEAQHGTKKTLVVYFLSYVCIALFMGSLFTYLIETFPNNEVVLKGFSRAWMGGSVGVFALIAALGYYSTRKWFLFSMIFAFEVFNHFILGNNIYISFIHIMSGVFGWLTIWGWEIIADRKENAKLKAIKAN